MFRFVAITMFALPFLAIGQDKVSGSVESENLVSSKTTPQLNIYIQGPIGNSAKFGWSAWSLTSKPWSEAYAGPTWTPRAWITLSVSAGLETNKHPFRGAGSVWVGKAKWAESYTYERGGSGVWYKSLATYQLTKRTAIGAFSQSFVGSGPYAERKVGKFLLWGTFLRRNGESQGLIGLRFNFPK